MSVSDSVDCVCSLVLPVVGWQFLICWGSSLPGLASRSLHALSQPFWVQCSLGSLRCESERTFQMLASAPW